MPVCTQQYIPISWHFKDMRVTNLSSPEATMVHYIMEFRLLVTSFHYTWSTSSTLDLMKVVSKQIIWGAIDHSDQVVILYFLNLCTIKFSLWYHSTLVTSQFHHPKNFPHATPSQINLLPPKPLATTDLLSIHIALPFPECQYYLFLQRK